MVSRRSLFFSICTILGLGLTIIIPVYVITNNLKDYGFINKEISFYHTPSNISTLKYLNLDCDIGDIEINYRYPPNGETISILTSIEMSGFNLANKSYLDFFIISFKSNSTSVDFSLETKQDINLLTILTLIKNITISVIVRADAFININADVDYGNVNLMALSGVDICNVKLNTTQGNISTKFYNCYIGGNILSFVKTGSLTYDLNDCNIQGNISGSTKDGYIKCYLSNANYTRDSSFFFNITQGDIDLYIYQYQEIGANITGRALIDNGNLKFIYDDNTVDVGARFEIPFGTHTSYELPPCCLNLYEDCDISGFEYNQSNYEVIHQIEGSLVFTSNDLLQKRILNYYDVVFELIRGSFRTQLNSLD